MKRASGEGKHVDKDAAGHALKELAGYVVQYGRQVRALNSTKSVHEWAEVCK